MKKAIQRSTVASELQLPNTVPPRTVPNYAMTEGMGHCMFLAIAQTAAKSSAHFSRIHLFLMMKEMREINPQFPQLQNRPSKNRLTPSYRLKQSCRSLRMTNTMLPRVGIRTSLINNLAPGLFNAVAKCADQIVTSTTASYSATWLRDHCQQ